MSSLLPRCGAGTVALESNRVLMAAGVDGKIRILDASLRSDKVERTLDVCNVRVQACGSCHWWCGAVWIA